MVITVCLEFDFVIATWKATKEAERAKWGVCKQNPNHTSRAVAVCSQGTGSYLHSLCLEPSSDIDHLQRFIRNRKYGATMNPHVKAVSLTEFGLKVFWGLCGKVLIAGGYRGGFCDKNPEPAPR